MDAVFQVVLKMSLSATVLVAFVVIARLLLKKAPRWITCILWALVAIKLVCPLPLKSPVSVMPDTQPIVTQIMTVQSYISNPEPIPQPNGFSTENPQNLPEQSFVFRFWILWAAGASGMLLYMLFSYLRVRKQVSCALQISGNLWQCDQITTPFIFGFLRPKIYLPSTLKEPELACVISHERAHLHRKDHWWKPLGFFLLCIHWFNPVIWLGYILLCRDIELACDEKVIKTMSPAEKATYSEALLALTMRQRFVTACPLAFGENSVKARIKSVLNYKKPAFWVILISLLLCAGLAVGLLTEQSQTAPDPTTESTQDPNLLANTLVGTVLQQKDDSLELRVSNADHVAVLTVDIGDVAEPPQLFLGDTVQITYTPSDDFSHIDRVTDILLLQEADWGVVMQLSSVSPTGLTLWLTQNSSLPRNLKTSPHYILQQHNGQEWVTLPRQQENNPENTQTIWLENGMPYQEQINWETLYGVLQPGQYQLRKTIVCETQVRSYCVRFSIEQVLSNDLDTTVNQTVRYVLSKQLVNPVNSFRNTLEHLEQLSVSIPTDSPVSMDTSITFEQITESHIILDYQQAEKHIHTFSILGLCRGYNSRLMCAEFRSPILLVIQEDSSGNFYPISCKMPRENFLQADTEFLFSSEIAIQMLDSKLQYKTLANACDQQVEGGVIQIIGFQRNFAKDSVYAKLMLQAIENGKKQKKPSSMDVNYTVIIGNTVYYYNSGQGIFNNVTEGYSITLSQEGRQNVNMILADETGNTRGELYDE